MKSLLQLPAHNSWSLMVWRGGRGREVGFYFQLVSSDFFVSLGERYFVGGRGEWRIKVFWVVCFFFFNGLKSEYSHRQFYVGSSECECKCLG